MRITPNTSVEYHASVYRDLDADAATRNHAARTKLPCSECGGDFGMRGGWTREAVHNLGPLRQLYSCEWDDHELYTICVQCNTTGTIPPGFEALSQKQVASWLARECQCPDCRRERGE